MPDFDRWPARGGDPSLNEINRADRFIDALSSSQPVYSTDSAEAELAFLFADWRDEVRTAPVTAPVTERDAVEALNGALTSRRRSRGSLALVGSVAAAMLCVGGFGAAVYGAGPGDSLYGMRSSLFGTQQVTRDDQVSLASAQLQQVQQLIDQGQWQQAQDKLVEVSSAVQGVNQVADKQQLVEQWNALTYKVVEQNPAATLQPGQPLPELPSSPLTWLPVPVVEATTTTQTTVTSTVSSDVTTSPTSSVTDSSGSPVPPEVLSTTTPDGASPTTPSPTTPSPSTPSPTTSSPVTSSPSTSSAGSTAPQTTTAPPTTASTTTTTTTAATAPASATTRPVQTAPASPAPSSAKPEATVPAGETVAPSTPVASNAPSAPAATPIPQPSSAAAATTTVVPPR